jgi:hypothetical protein
MEHRRVHPVFLEYLWHDILDHSNIDFAIDWGKKMWDEIVASKKIDIENKDGKERSRVFLYNLALVVIFAEFSKYAFNDYWNDESTIFLDQSNIGALGDNLTTFLEKDCVVTTDASGTWVELQGIWSAVSDAKTFIYKTLREKYDDDKLYEMLKNTHATHDIKEGKVYLQTQSFGQEMDSYTYVSNGFQC